MDESKGLSIQIIIIAGTLLFLLLVLIIMLVLYLYQRKRFLQVTEITQLKGSFEQILLTTQIEIQEQTLRQISQELHDNISQKLGLLKIQINQLQSQNPTLNLLDCKVVLTETISDLRVLSKSFHPDRIGSIPLKENIENELTLVKRASGSSIVYSIDGDDDSLQPEQKIILFRIFQELLNNALRYANASKIEVQLRFDDNFISLYIQDNGDGLPVDYQKGIGHTSMQNRVNLLQGSFHLESERGKGTLAKVEIPKR